MTGAMILMFLGALLYGVVALMFLAFSCAELIDTNRSSRLRLALAIGAAIVWPVALVLASVAAVLMARPRSAVHGQSRTTARHAPAQPAEGLPGKRIAA